MLDTHLYENTMRVVYQPGGATFVPVCYQCGRYVKADENIFMRYDGLAKQPNATCSKCGRTEMLFEGFI